jgi:hypothetical protein
MSTSLAITVVLTYEKQNKERNDVTPGFVKSVRRIILRWVASPPFQPKLHSAVPIYPRALNSRLRRRMIRRHNVHSPALRLL